jgi:hypothetical protein
MHIKITHLVVFFVSATPPLMTPIYDFFEGRLDSNWERLSIQQHIRQSATLAYVFNV